jgi:hypothetical protein
MTLGTPVITNPGRQGTLVKSWFDFMARQDASIAQVFDKPTISLTVTTTTNDTGEVIDLNDYFTFLDDHVYPIRIRHTAQTENDRYYQTLDYLVVGRVTAATDPVIIGDGALSTGVQGKISNAFGVLAGVAQAYGRVTYNGVLDVEATDGTNSHGLAAAAFSSGASVLTVPLKRTMRVIGTHVEQETFSAAEAAYAVVEDLDATVTIRAVQADDGTGATNPTAGTNITVTADVYPPVNAFLVVDGTPDPGHVTVHVLGISSDECLHTMDIFIGDPIYTPFQGS